MNVAGKTPEPADNFPALRLEIPDHKSVIVGELAQNGEWIVANVSTSSFWPVTSQKVRWRGIDIWIMPIMKGYFPAVAVMVPPGKSRAECDENGDHGDLDHGEPEFKTRVAVNAK